MKGRRFAAMIIPMSRQLCEILRPYPSTEAKEELRNFLRLPDDAIIDDVSQMVKFHANDVAIIFYHPSLNEVPIGERCEVVKPVWTFRGWEIVKLDNG